MNEDVHEREKDGLVVGHVVALRADHTSAGPIIAELESIGGRRRYGVYHSATQIRDYFVT